jgi:dipeptide/tripeptide permease
LGDSRVILISRAKPEMTKVNSSPSGWSAAAYVLALQSCLSFAYYGATANLVLLLQNYAGATESHAESLVNYFGAVVGLTPLLGGYLSDKVMGCFNTILLGGSIFTVSLVALTWGVHYTAARCLILPMLFVMMPLGYGFLTANMNVFGSHQFAEEREKSSWFSWFYFCINIGSVLAFLIPGMIQQNYSFTSGLALPCVIIVAGLCAFASAKSRFVHPNSGEPSADVEKVETPLTDKTDTTQLWRKVLPCMLLTIVFSICYCQMQTTWYVQAMWMNRNMFGVVVPVSYMMCADPIFVMLGISVLEGYVFPRLQEKHMMPSPITRMAIGMGFACCGMYSAYHVERVRLQAVMHGNMAHPSPVSMFLQIPQFAFVAFAEIFVYTTIMDFAISQAPNSMKSTINALNTFMGSIANVIAGVMTTWCSSWIPPSNPNYGHYDRFYLLLGALSLAGGIGFHMLRETRKSSMAMKSAYSSI